MVPRISARIALTGALICMSACAGTTDRQLAAAPAGSRYAAPLIFEWVGLSGRACGYRMRRGQMNLTVDRSIQCPSTVVCQTRRTSTEPLCKSPVAPWRVS